jgi:hypothetical protein
MNIETLRSSESVRRWLASRVVLWGSDVDKENEEELFETLARFCQTVAKSPDEMVDECLRRSTEGGPFVLRTRARREYMERINDFERETGSRDSANVIRSFFIHNGVAMNPSILTS